MPGPYYVRSTDGSDADFGTTWALAKATIGGALAIAAAGDTIYVSQSHAESGAGANNLTGPGTVASPCRIICVNDGAEPPTAVATTATVTTTSTGVITLSGYNYIYGISFIQGSGNNSSSALVVVAVGTPAWICLEKCLLRHASSGSSANITLNATSSSIDDAMVEFIDTQVQFAATGQTLKVFCKFRWTSSSGLAAFAGGTIPTTLFPSNTDAAGYSEIIGIDFSQLTSGKSLVTLASASSHDYTFINCKLSTTGSLTAGSSSGPGASRVKFIGCSAGSNNYELDDNSYQGRVTTETTVVRTSPVGATNGTTTTSRKMVSSSSAKFESPLTSDWIEYWNETTGSAVVITIATVTDNITLTDREAWIEVQALTTSGFPVGAITSDRATDIIATGANQTTDSGSTWTTTGLTTPVKQSLSVSVTPQLKGVIRARVCLAKASTTVYFDPLISAGGRQYQTSGGFVNGPAATGGGVIVIEED